MQVQFRDNASASRAVLCFKEEIRAPFQGVLPEISVYFEGREQMCRAIEVLIANSNLPSSTMQREGSVKRELLSQRHSAKEVVQLVQSGRHILLKKPFGLPDLGIGVLEDSMRLDFRPGPEWDDQQIERLIATLKVLRGRAEISDICLDEMSEHFSQVGTSGFQELLEGDNSDDE
jgi:hypothetical protein